MVHQGANLHQRAYDPILIAKTGPFVDYEVELVAVIGKGGRNISKTDAHRHVFGYCVGNDVTERMWQHRTPQWSLGKSFDTHAPIGPWISTADEIVDLGAVDRHLRLEVDIHRGRRRAAAVSAYASGEGRLARRAPLRRIASA